MIPAALAASQLAEKPLTTRVATCTKLEFLVASLERTAEKWRIPGSCQNWAVTCQADY